ncbi:MAG: mono/diheme cytochrome c family protein [Verrucomicrobiales bacterium]|jgi:mono/diheme cytochrome c family protein
MILAQTAVRNVGLVIFAIVIVGFVLYLLFNLLDSKGEGGAEVELAANRKPYFDDDILETRKLDQSLMSGLVLLSIIGIALPLYWLGEPGRQEGYVENILELWTEDGAESFEEGCSSCHGGGGAGGVAAFAITEAGSGNFVASVDWVAPSLTSVLTRFSEEEVIYTLNFGRNGVMPAWGAPGGGPLTEQQIDILITYLRSIQKDGDAVQAAVFDGLVEGARLEMVRRDPALNAELQEAQFGLAGAQQTGVGSIVEEAQAVLSSVQKKIGDEFTTDEMADWLGEISDPSHPDYLTYGELLFTNRADAGGYGCARCHTSGWSYDGANDLDLNGDPLTTIIDDSGAEVAGHVQGGGWFGPNLTNGSTVRQFPQEDQMIDFIRRGSANGQRYGIAGQGDGQMPGFAFRLDESLDPKVQPEHVQGFVQDVAGADTVVWPAILTEAQIAAIVAYERSL